MALGLRPLPAGFFLKRRRSTLRKGMRQGTDIQVCALCLKIAGNADLRASHKMSQLPLAARMLIKETTADVEISVIAGWQGGPFVLGKPLRESDHSGGRRRWPT